MINNPRNGMVAKLCWSIILLFEAKTEKKRQCLGDDDDDSVNPFEQWWYWALRSFFVDHVTMSISQAHVRTQAHALMVHMRIILMLRLKFEPG